MKQNNRLFIMLKTETKTKSHYKKIVSIGENRLKGMESFNFTITELSFLWNFRNNDFFYSYDTNIAEKILQWSFRFKVMAFVWSFARDFRSIPITFFPSIGKTEGKVSGR